MSPASFGISRGMETQATRYTGTSHFKAWSGQSCNNVLDDFSATAAGGGVVGPVCIDREQGATR